VTARRKSRLAYPLGSLVIASLDQRRHSCKNVSHRLGWRGFDELRPTGFPIDGARVVAQPNAVGHQSGAGQGHGLHTAALKGAAALDGQASARPSRWKAWVDSTSAATWLLGACLYLQL